MYRTWKQWEMDYSIIRDSDVREMDPTVLNNEPNYKTRTKPNLNGMGYTFKGRVPNM